MAEVAKSRGVLTTAATAVAAAVGPSHDAPSPALAHPRRPQVAGLLPPPPAAVAVSSASLAPSQGSGRVTKWVGASAPSCEEGQTTLLRGELPAGVPPRGCLHPPLTAKPSPPSLTAARSLSPLSSDALSRARQASADGRTLSMGTRSLLRPQPRTGDPVAADGSADLLGPVVDVDTLLATLLARRMYAAYRAYSLLRNTHCSRITAHCSLLGTYYCLLNYTGAPPTAPTPPAPTAWRCAGRRVPAAHAQSPSLDKTSA